MTIGRGQLLGHQERRGQLRTLGERARQSELIEFEFNSSTSSQSVTREIVGANQIPLTIVWYLGTLNSDGSILDDNATIVPKQYQKVSCGPNIEAQYKASIDEFDLDLTLSGVSGNSTRTAYFYYVTFYDSPETPLTTFTSLNISYIPVNSILSAEAFGTALIQLYLEPSAITSDEAFGTASLDSVAFVEPTDISSAEAFGTAVVSLAGVATYDEASITYDDAGTAYDG